MRFRKLKTLSFVPAVLIAACLAAAADAQDPKLPPAFNGTAKIVATGQGAIHIINDKAEEFFVQVDPTTTVTLAGNVEESFLTPGTVVRFSAEFDDKGAIKGDIASLTVVELSVVVQAGVFRDGDPTEAAAEKGKKKPTLAGTYLVVGQVKSCKKGALNVQAPGAKLIKTKLAADAKLEIDVANYAWARPDDEITIDGSLVQESRVVKNKVQPGTIVAKKVDIKPATPLTAESKKKGKGKKTSKAKDKSKGKGKDANKTEPAKDKAGEAVPAEGKAPETKAADDKPADKPAEKPAGAP